MFEVNILTVKPELTQKDFNTLLPLVSLEKQERIKRFLFFKDARNCLLGDILTRIEICRATGLSNKQLEFVSNIHGKPFLINEPRIHFNISHTGDYISVALYNQPVGIDIEQIKSADIKIANRFFSIDEQEYIFSKQDSEINRRFIEVWTKKESLIKFEGKGLHIPLPSFCVFEPSSCTKIFYHNVFQNDEVICHACSSKQDPPTVRLIDTSHLLKDIIKKEEHI